MKAKLPPQYSARERKQAAFEQKTRDEAIDYASELALVVIANILIEKHGWGCGKSATRLQALFDEFERVIHEDGERYGYDCVLTAQRRKLRERGVHLHTR